MTDAQVMKRICSFSKNWEETWEKERLNYIVIAIIGRELIEDVSKQRNLERVNDVLKEVESILLNAQQNILSLIGAGLFEAMQIEALNTFTTKSMDIMDNYLGPRSLIMWKDIIEGWNGKGIRSIEDSSKIMFRISVGKVALIQSQNKYEAEASNVVIDSNVYFAEELLEIENYYESKYKSKFSKPFASIIINRGSEMTEVIVGEYINSSSLNRVVCVDESRIFSVESIKIENLIERIKLNG